MVSTPSLKMPIIRASKINHKSGIPHPLVRFVTEETVALLFNLELEEIYRIDCWRHVVYVHGKGVSKFVSYADFPPILGVEAPTPSDFVRWRKRWKNRWKRQVAPEFWEKLYSHYFNQASTEAQLVAWGKLVAVIKSVLPIAAVQHLRDAYKYEKHLWENF
ncbi:MAG TPA: hypothetical protein DCP31_31350 [Cyanobacteria bacterium UBA8543]|nr:hypothetical protein [Cyanobacteria bacterium UBA8543]